MKVDDLSDRQAAITYMAERIFEDEVKSSGVSVDQCRDEWLASVAEASFRAAEQFRAVLESKFGL